MITSPWKYVKALAVFHSIYRTLWHYFPVLAVKISLCCLVPLIVVLYYKFILPFPCFSLRLEKTHSNTNPQKGWLFWSVKYQTNFAYKYILVVSWWRKLLMSYLWPISFVTRFWAQVNLVFVKGKSTIDCIAVFLHEVLHNNNNNLLTGCFFLYYSKVFDCVNHFLLVTKSCFLDHVSSFKPVTNGVPQGLVLGHTLLNLYINDITNHPLKSRLLLTI